MSERPELKAHFESTPTGTSTLSLEISIVGESRGAVAILVDLSDSADITDQDLLRLRRLLQSLPRQWTVILDSLGPALPGCPTTNVADIVDGVLDLPGLFLRQESLRQQRRTGSFLGPALHRSLDNPCFRDAERQIVLVMTDGHLHDIEPLANSRSWTIVGLGLARGTANAERWHKVVPGAEHLTPERTDAGKRVRDLAGIRFCDNCRVDVPGVAFNYRAAHDCSTTPAKELVNGPIDWAFGLGNLLFEIPLADGHPVPTHVTIREEGGAEVSLPVNVTGTTPHSPAAGDAVTPVATHGIDVVPANQARVLAAHLKDLVERKRGWQDESGSLHGSVTTLPTLASWLDGSGEPSCDGMLLVIPPIPEQDGGEIPILSIALHGNRENIFTAGSVLGSTQAFGCDVTHEFSFHRLDARWVFRVASTPPKYLPPRSSIVIADSSWRCSGDRCEVFFSGPLRLSRSR